MTRSSASELYLDLLEDGLLGIHRNQELMPLNEPRTTVGRLAHRVANSRGITLARAIPDARDDIEQGLIWPANAETMIGRARMRNIRYCVEAAIRDEIPGDLIETGVWRGGACIFMRGILAAHQDTRTVWLADSFAGFPPRTHSADHAIRPPGEERLAVSVDEVRQNFARFRLLDDQVRFVEGYFRDTLPSLSDQKWSVVRLDGDLYESTMDALTSLYPQLSPGGFLIVDDYGILEACRRAVEDYRSEQGITESIERIDSSGVYWRRAR